MKWLKSALTVLASLPLVYTLGCDNNDKVLEVSTEKQVYAVGETVQLEGFDSRNLGPVKHGFEETEVLDQEDITVSKDIFLKSRTISPKEKVSEEARAKLEQGEKFHAIIQTDNPDELEAIGIEIDRTNYLPTNSYFATIDSSLEQVLTEDDISYIEVLRPEDKIGFEKTEEMGATVYFHEDVSLEEAQRVLGNVDATVWDGNGETKDASRLQSFSLDSKNIIGARIPTDNLDELAGEDSVYYIGMPAVELSNLNVDARRLSHVNIVNEHWGLKGEGVNVLIYDGSQVDTWIEDLKDPKTGEERIEYLDIGGWPHYHATHVACTVMGNGAKSEEKDYPPLSLRGMAPLATGFSDEYDACDPYCFYNSPQDIDEEYYRAIGKGIDIATNSIGSNACFNYPDIAEDINGQYEISASLMDEIIYDTDLITLFAAGNERGDYECSLQAWDTIGVPATAKNVIAVGALDKELEMAYFSSWGPTDDGRLKPEVCGIGVNVNSCMTWGETYMELSGTSMATPHVAGMTALMVEALKESYDYEQVPFSLVKAIMFNTAEEWGNEGPDYQCGYGFVDTANIVDGVFRNHFFSGELSGSYAKQQHYIFIDDQKDLKVTMAWIDQAAAPNSSKTLVNDLDMVLIDPDGNVYDPYVLDPYNTSLPATTGNNDTDTSEQIYVKYPTNGLWEVQVLKKSGTTDPARYDIAYSIEHDTSLIKNYDAECFEGNLEAVVEKKSKDDEWEKIKTVIPETEIHVPSRGDISIYKEWDYNGAFTPTEPGEYRTRVWLENDDGEPMYMGYHDMEEEWYFDVVSTE